METPNVKPMLTPEPFLNEINASQHNYAAAGPNSLKATSKSTSDWKRSERSLPKHLKKSEKLNKARMSATLDSDKDSHLDSRVSAHRTPYGRYLQSEYFTLVSRDPSDGLYSSLNHLVHFS